MNEMRRAINNLLELSKREEDLKQQSQSAPPNSPQLRQNAQDQMRIMQDLSNVIQGLSEVSQRSFAITPEMGQSIGEALGRMSAVAQMAWVELYLSRQQKAVGSLKKAYQLAMAVFYPVAAKWESPYREFPSDVQAANPGIRTPADYVALMNRGARLPDEVSV